MRVLAKHERMRGVTWWSLALEFKSQDCWIGAYWHTQRDVNDELLLLDVWVCVLPTLPIHFQRCYGLLF